MPARVAILLPLPMRATQLVERLLMEIVSITTFDSLYLYEGGRKARSILTPVVVTIYVAQPEREYGDIAVLYLTDVFGIQLKENKL